MPVVEAPTDGVAFDELVAHCANVLLGFDKVENVKCPNESKGGNEIGMSWRFQSTE